MLQPEPETVASSRSTLLEGSIISQSPSLPDGTRMEQDPGPRPLPLSHLRVDISTTRRPVGSDTPPRRQSLICWHNQGNVSEPIDEEPPGRKCACPLSAPAAKSARERLTPRCPHIGMSGHARLIPHAGSGGGMPTESSPTLPYLELPPCASAWSRPALRKAFFCDGHPVQAHSQTRIVTSPAASNLCGHALSLSGQPGF
ncbi:hypothetical protein PYCCODRAFT_335585 [Trametes coccinea BRFM310]|uniref:Uncharacterized protein n=1 Tax=Trametes coccinea (strain BRFM310) TaxID=1353009 RepID=A0A1Y2J2T6_TRAC3|nr:hypothetical protein PYCCODRAFT_335585 [Trametes coccinea BRFM310]